MIKNTFTRPTGKTSVLRTVLIGAGLVLLALTGSMGLASSAGAVAKAPRDFVGIVPQEGINHTDTQRMKRGKVTVLRAPVGWSVIQPDNAHEFQWGSLDGTVRAAAREGVRVMPTFYDTPKWVSHRSTNLPTRNGHQIKLWRKFILAAVQRYGSTGDFWKEPLQVDSNLPKLPIREWQIWNEANFHYFATPVSPTDYARLLNASAGVIHNNDPRGKAVIAGLFAKPRGSKRQAMDATEFIKRVAKRAKRSSIDSLAIHPYAANVHVLKRYMRDFRRAANQAGLRSKPIQITEIGWGSGRKTNSFLTGSKAAQGRILKDSYQYLLRDRRKLRLTKAYWFAWQDTDPKGVNCSFCYTIGLFEHRKSTKLVAKPAWRQMVRFTRGRP